MANEPRGRILLVESDDRALAAHARTLARAGFEVEATGSAADARSLFEKERFDVVLSDGSAPRTDAAALIRAIRERDKDVPVILMTAKGGLEAGPAAEPGVECLPKPVAPTTLERAVERAMRSLRGSRVPTFRNRQGEEVEVASFTATAAKNEFGRLLQKAVRAPVLITRNDEPEAVVVSFDEFRDLARARESKLEALAREFDALLTKMQTPAARRGMKAAFDATPAEMGEAAATAARKRG